MSHEQRIISDITSAHEDAIADVNRWWGHCLELFARIEQTLAEKLVANQRTVPQAILAKLSAVAELLTRPKAKTLERLRQLAEARNLIVHATSSVWIDANDNWLWAYRFIPTGKDKAPIEGHWDRHRARAFEKELSSMAQSLRDQLRSK